jgi:ceramide glucosyltransferase
MSSVVVVHIAFTALELLCCLAAVFGIGITLSMAGLSRRFFTRSIAQPGSFPPVTLVKPLHGDEEALLENLSSFFEQDYPAPIQYVFGVHDPADPALQTVEQIRKRYPQAHVTVVADSRLYGPNRKMSNVLNMIPEAQHDVLVFADSDVGVDPGYLRHIVGELQAPGVGLVTCLYRGKPCAGLWPRLSARATNYQFVPSVVLGLALGLARPCFGQTIALRRATLEKIGGFAPFVHHLAEDHAIGEAVRAAGEQVAIPPFIVTHDCVERSATQLVLHELRWSRTIRTIDPLGHLGSALTQPLAFALLGVIMTSGAWWSWALLLAALSARLVLQLQLDRALGQPHRDLWLLPIWDLCSFTIFIASFFSMRVTWRGSTFRVGNDGLLYPIGDK